MTPPYSFPLKTVLFMILIPIALYIFCVLIKWQPNPFAEFRRWYVSSGNHATPLSKKDDMELIIMSSSLGKDIECPVCLSVFIDDEELGQLKICKHLFHKNCIDKWLSTHFNCPICRALVNNQYEIKEKEDRSLSSRNVDRSDLWQGLPDSSGLV